MSGEISHFEYDLLTTLQNKSEAIKAEETYIQDAQELNSQPSLELFQRLHEKDIQYIQELRHHLQEVIQNGSM